MDKIAVELPGRTAVLFYLEPSEYFAIKKKAKQDKLSMTMIVRHLVYSNLFKDELGAGLRWRGTSPLRYAVAL